jgi:hypothetical protein
VGEQRLRVRERRFCRTPEVFGGLDACELGGLDERVEDRSHLRIAIHGRIEKPRAEAVVRRPERASELAGRGRALETAPRTSS